MESLPFSRKALVLSFLWQSADARVDARCCKLGHVQLLLSAVMEKGSGYMGQVSGGQSDRAAGKKVLGGCGGAPVSYFPWVSGGVTYWVPHCSTLADGCRDLTN